MPERKYGPLPEGKPTRRDGSVSWLSAAEIRRKRSCVGARFRSGVELLRQPCFAQSIKVMFVVFCLLERDGPPRDARYRIIGYQSHDLGRLRPSLLELAQLRVDCS